MPDSDYRPAVLLVGEQEVARGMFCRHGTKGLGKLHNSGNDKIGEVRLHGVTLKMLDNGAESGPFMVSKCAPDCFELDLPPL